jgi:calcium-binding protein CML
MDSSSSPKSISAFGRVKKMLSPKRKEQIEEQRVTTNDSDSELSISCCSGADATNLKTVFNHFDEDNDGKLSASELISCVKTVGGDLSIEEAEAAVKSSDLNGDGVIDFHEFHTMMDTTSGSEEEKKTELKQAFGIYDIEGCGVITAEGLKKMLSRLGESRTINDCKAMIRAFDLNDDGVLSFDEFLVMMR